MSPETAERADALPKTPSLDGENPWLGLGAGLLAVAGPLLYGHAAMLAYGRKGLRAMKMQLLTEVRIHGGKTISWKRTALSWRESFDKLVAQYNGTLDHWNVINDQLSEATTKLRELESYAAKLEEQLAKRREERDAMERELLQERSTNLRLRARVKGLLDLIGAME